MAEIKLPTVSYKDIGEKGARYALDEVEYNDLTIRQWADKITGGEYAPVVYARWEMKPEDTTPGIYHVKKAFCTNCGKSNKQYRPPYCPHCGAKMDGLSNG